MTDWGVHKHGAILHINEQPLRFLDAPIFVDVETDEKDNFVGLGYTQTGTEVYYTTDLSTVSRHIGYGINQKYLRGSLPFLVGHNLKFDAKLLVKWGIDVKPDQIFGDTMLMSYAMNATKESHGLKELGAELGYVWPSYKEIVGKGRQKRTLEQQDVELVANYCAMDVFVTYQLYQSLRRKMDLNAQRVYSQIELPLMRILFEMELKGVLVNVNRLKELDDRFSSQLAILINKLRTISGRDSLNPNSNKQVADVLTGFGITLPKTTKGNLKVDKFVLEQHQDREFVITLLQYNKLEKLVSTYTKGMLKRETLPRIYTTYNQVTTKNGTNTETGISTGRLSSSGPNLQQIPARTEEGKLLRELFIPEEGNVLIDADYSQIEYRLLAHFTKEPILLEAFRNGKDVHEETGIVLGVNRDTGKTLNFASIYGAQAGKIARTAKVTEEQAEQFLEKYWCKLPHVTAWINRVKYEARQKKGIYTLMKRWIPIPGIESKNIFERWHYERAAVNYLIQGSAAEIMKMAMIELRKKGYLPLLTVHDELLFEVPFNWLKDINPPEITEIKETMESIVKLDVPIVADVGVGGNWRESKED